MTANAERGLQRIGDPLQAMLPLPEALVSIPTKSQMSSETTGLLCLAGAVAKSTGIQHSEIDAVSLREMLRGKNPAETDRVLLALLPPCVRSDLREIRTRISFPANGGYVGGEFSGYETVYFPEPERREAMALVKRTLAPITEREAKAELLRLRASVKTRAEDGDDIKAIAAVFLSYVIEYPADIVRWACRFWADREKFWPSWSELRELLERGMRLRRALVRVLGS